MKLRHIPGAVGSRLFRLWASAVNRPAAAMLTARLQY